MNNEPMDGKTFTDSMRRPLHERDGRAILAVLASTGLPPYQLQLTGIGLLFALAGEPAAAEPPARELLAALADRRWAGDEELAAELRAALGDPEDPDDEPAAPLTTVPVRLSDIAEAMDSSDDGGRINLQTGWVSAGSDLAYDIPEDLQDEEFEDPDRWLGIQPAGSRTGWRDMADFIDTVADPRRADQLARAIQGGGAFRRFKDTLHRWPDEPARWYAFAEDRQLGRAREFLAAEGFRADRY